MTTRVAIHGAAGRMGRRLIALGSADEHLQVVAALEASSHPRLGSDAGTEAGVGEIGVPLSAGLDPQQPIDAVIDFSTPQGAAVALELCAARKLPLVMATTGLPPALQEDVRKLSGQVPVVWAPNMSLAVNLTMKLSEIAAGILKKCGVAADVEILERHHRFKEDAPSGTALKFGELIANVMDLSQHTHGRVGQTGKRSRDEIGYHAIRVGDNPGEHTIVFGMLGETVELTVRASNRDCYALGALQAARFVAGQKPGLYNMSHVLGLLDE